MPTGSHPAPALPALVLMAGFLACPAGRSAGLGVSGRPARAMTAQRFTAGGLLGAFISARSGHSKQDQEPEGHAGDTPG
jgi:hypothetical protein